MTHSVWLTNDAVQDLERLYDYIAQTDAPQKADLVLTRLNQAIDALKELPNRGNIPHELLCIGIRSYREIHVRPYRIIYRVIDGDVYVYCIADGRRDMQDLLQRRLLET